MMFRVSMPAALAAVALISAQPLVDADVLEPSVQNEVDHALDVAPTNAPPASAAMASVFALEGGRLGTNGLDRTQMAIRLVSAQGADGRWMDGTNDVTSAAVEILRSL